MSNKIFEQTKQDRPNKSAFDLSREQKLSCNIGELVPTYLEEVLPSDQFRVKTETMIRLAPMLAPVMHRVNVYMHYFFVPNRIVWSQWEDFITGGPDGTTEPIYPAAQMGVNFRSGPLADYLGIPPSSTYNDEQKISTLPFRAYQKIWNEYYRDPTFQEELDVETATVEQLGNLRQRCFEKDYFTSALPFTQRGPEIGIPIELKYRAQSELRSTATGDLQSSASNIQSSLDGGLIADSGSAGATESVRIENLEGDTLDFTINELRKSSALQRWLEKNATGGPRYVEQILTHFGVRSSDQRLNRPEYLGGGSQPIVMSEVLNTSATATEPQGDMSGHGISVGETNTFQKTFEEHGYVMGILSVMPKTAYFQGIPRHFLRNDKHDYYWPEFADLGEQEIKNVELYYDEADQTYNDGIFGYQQRYAEYKYGQSTVHGNFRDNLSFWHMARDFSSQPALNASFLRYPPIGGPHNRVFAVDETIEDQLWVQLYHNVKARRPMPFFADPKLT